MFKIILAEIKKMVSKPGVFVLAILLACILVLGVFIYEPSKYTTTNIDFKTDAINTYNNFYGNGSNSGIKAEYDEMIENSKASLEAYYINGIGYNKHFQNLLSQIKTNVNSYKECQLYDSHVVSDQKVAEIKLNLINSLKNLKESVINAVKLSAAGSYAVLTSKNNLDNLESTLTQSGDHFSKQVARDKIADECLTFEQQYQSKIEQCLNNLIFPNLSENLLKDYTKDELGTKYYEIKQRLFYIFHQIEELKSSITEQGNKSTLEQDKEMADLCNKYVSTANTYTNLVNYELLSNAFSQVKTKDQIDMMYLSNQNEFNANTNLIRYQYLFKHNATENEFAHPLTIGTTSNAEKNGYDYAYFILRLFSFVIVAYAIMSACHAIAGEAKEGTLRYLAIRPVSRTKVLFGKMLAIILMSTIFAIFSTIIALIVGGVVYGLESATILTIFNGTTAITLRPLGMLLIYVGSMLVELTIYVSIALLLSCLLKSDLLAVTLMLMLYLLNILIPAFVSNPTSWLAFYPFSHISIYSLFGSSVYATSNDFLNIILSAKVFTNTTLWLTLTVILVISIVVNIASTRIFKRKEL